MAKKKNELDYIIVQGAKEHNLKNVNLKIPKKKLVVITGVSGSGKSSLAFDTLFAEGQRRYVESLSSYARQFIGQMEKPKYDTIRGLSPTIAIEQKSASRNPRSTVGTITEIYDYLRVLYARVGEQHCMKCASTVGRGDAEEMVDQIQRLAEGSKIILLAPIVENRKGEHREHLDKLKREGFSRVRIDGIIQHIDDVQLLSKNKKHTIDVVIDRLILKSAMRKRLTDSVELGLKHGLGQLIVHVDGGSDLRMSEERTCCGIAYPELHPNLFSFNSPLGMCSACNGIGSLLAMDPDKIIPDKNLTIRQGAILPWKNYFLDSRFGRNKNSWGLARIEAIRKQWGIDLDMPWKKIPLKKQNMILFGANESLQLDWSSQSFQGQVNTTFEGLVHSMMRRYRLTQSEGAKKYYEKFMSDKSCRICNGKRLRQESLFVKIDQKAINDVVCMTIGEAYDWVGNLNLQGNKKVIAQELLKEISSRLSFLVNVGLEYLSLERNGPTLSGGESQRIRLASQIGSELTGVLYILDEPSIGLHQKDNKKLIDTLCHLRDIGNTLLIVEHDQETMQRADWIIDIGPGAGHLGGEVVAEGTYKQICSHKRSLTGMFLSGKKKIEIPQQRRRPTDKWIEIKGSRQNNLQNIDVKFPIGLFSVITGVSGAGKSSLVNQILYPVLSNHFHGTTLEVGKYDKVTGLDYINKIINIDQKPIGRTPRSNPATYTKVFDHIRDLFALLPEARERGYSKGRFSFNVRGGRCEKCEGDAFLRVEMHFLADVYVPCESCQGKRFNSSTLDVLFKGNSISDILNLSILQAFELFENYPKIRAILKTLIDVGLNYIKLGQPATTLSGGEAQRIKLARELSKRATGDTLYLLDEPTTGLHFQDIKMLLKVLNRLVDGGNTVVVIEHNMDVIKSADWVIDIGPDGGSKGGKLVAVGTPEHIIKINVGHTGKALKNIL